MKLLTTIFLLCCLHGSGQTIQISPQKSDTIAMWLFVADTSVSNLQEIVDNYDWGKQIIRTPVWCIYGFAVYTGLNDPIYLDSWMRPLKYLVTWLYPIPKGSIYIQKPQP